MTLRIPSSVAEKRRCEAARAERSRRLLRRLLRENLLLSRELEDLRAAQPLACGPQDQGELTGTWFSLPGSGRSGSGPRTPEGGSASEEPAPTGAPSGRGALVMVEVNDVPAIARALGEATAEAAVSDVAEVLRAAVRSTDICCRLGLGEFVMVMPDADPPDVGAVAVRIRTSLMWVSSRRDLPISVTMGTATWPADGDDVAALIARARRALSTERRRQRRRPGPPSAEWCGRRPAPATKSRR